MVRLGIPNGITEEDRNWTLVRRRGMKELMDLRRCRDTTEMLYVKTPMPQVAQEGCFRFRDTVKGGAVGRIACG
jgi:hypothetical protein